MLESNEIQAIKQQSGAQTSSSPSLILDPTSTIWRLSHINEVIINRPTHDDSLREITHVRSHRKMQAPTILIETIKGKKVNKPFKQKTHPKAFVA